MDNFQTFTEYVETVSESTVEKGTWFERMCRYFLMNDAYWSERFDKVWHWRDAPTCTGHDTGIDLVARDRRDGTYWAIQCKNYKAGHTTSLADVSTFLANAQASPNYPAGQYVLMTSNDSITKNLEKLLADSNTKLIRYRDIRDSNINWGPFAEGEQWESSRRTFDPRPHQEEAIADVVHTMEDEGKERCKLVMACGTGKTLTALRLAERLLPDGGAVLFAAPSIALVGQSMREWLNQARLPISAFVVCSDSKASQVDDDLADTLLDLPFPATTNPKTLSNNFAHDPGNGLKVVFSTYQSMGVVSDAQALGGVPEFDLVVCDEAHRTTGAVRSELPPELASEYVKVHDNSLIPAKRRVYMTATPRIYGDTARENAREKSAVLYSMDDEDIYGPVAHTLDFPKAVEADLLTDYRVIVLTMPEDAVPDRFRHEGTIEVSEAAKIIGTYKGLAKHGEGAGDHIENDHATVAVEDASEDEGEGVVAAPDPLHRAVIFCQSIKDSKQVAGYFDDVVQAYIDQGGDDLDLDVELEHVDGGMNAQVRAEKVRWLDDGNDPRECRVLTNARCLAEGVDVPSLDAVVFMRPRKSQVDVVQAVGRVMRKFEGKDYGYIILPVAVPAGMDAAEALNQDKPFEVVWKVLQALRSHDSRLDAKINALSLGKGKKAGAKKRTDKDGLPIGVEIGGMDGEPEQLVLELEDDLASKIEAKLVERCGTRVYWENWSADVARIAERYVAELNEAIQEDGVVAEEFGRFLQGLRDSLNPGISPADAVEMAAQHVITVPVFDALFEGFEFRRSNPVSVAIEEFLSVVGPHLERTPEDEATLQDLYGSVRLRAQAVKTDEARQDLIKDLYEEFFKKAFKSTSEKLGIVYTPSEVIDYILRETDRTLRREFGKGIADEGVHVLDGFAGTGSFMAQLIESDLIPDDKLPWKYEHELHSNEILLLAYYIMVVNIEQAYHARVGGEYEPFPGAVLCDTFQLAEDSNTLDVAMFTANTERAKRQMETPIHVIIGNPPYSVGQKSGNDNNQNEKYDTLDARIAQTYVASSDAGLNKSAYDSYVRAFRWASDRIGEKGVVCFVTNGGWLRAQSGAGLRRRFAEEFTSVHVFDLRGDARTNGEQRRKEKDNVFGGGTRTPVAITMLVKNPDSEKHGEVFYHDIGDYLVRDEKLDIVEASAITGDVPWKLITPDKHGDWLDQRDDSWTAFAPMGIQDGTKKSPDGVFSVWSLGVGTNRDPWAYSFSRDAVAENMERMCAKYNAEMSAWQASGCPKPIENHVDKDGHLIKWTRELYADASRGKMARFDPTHIRPSLYRPFTKKWVYMDRMMNNCVYLQPEFFPTATSKNLEISTTGPGSGREFSCLMTNVLPDRHTQSTGQCFPLYRYETNSGDGLFATGKAGYERRDAITDETLRVFQANYPTAYLDRAKKHGGPGLNKEDVFYYVYGVLHSPEYRERFAANLKKELPRVPLAGIDGEGDPSHAFERFADAGRALARLHVGYEGLDPWPGLVEDGDGADPGRTTKMRFGKCKKTEENPKGVDMTTLHVAERMTIRNIPLRAYDYVVNGRSAVAWLMDQYQVKTDKASGIVSDPNLYSDDPRYITDLVKRVVRVSMETLAIVDNLPLLHEIQEPVDCPAIWKTE